MKKIYAIITVAMIAATFAFAGCQKQEAPKPAEQSSATSTTMSSMTTTATTTATEPAAPMHK